MSEYKNFQAKNVDEAIAEAGRHFKCSREELEVEIVSGGSSGIFGLVGVKKATIKARKRQAQAEQSPAKNERGKGSSGKPDNKPSSRQKPAGQQLKGGRPQEAEAVSHKEGKRSSIEEKAPLSEPSSTGASGQADSFYRPSNEPVDMEAARECILETIKVLLTNISEDNEIRLDMDKTPIELAIDDDANSGLIIGREGQTISAMQYLLNRIVSRKHPGVGRIQLNAGCYREKQEEQLRKTALFLAQKARTSQRPQSTRVLSSYHRRVVHMALQDDREIITRSKGDGPLKRVLIMPRYKADHAGQSGRTDYVPRQEKVQNEQEA